MPGPEKLEEFRQDLLVEEKLRRDFEYCVQIYVDSVDTVDSEGLKNYLKIYGWIIDDDIINSILEEYKD